MPEEDRIGDLHHGGLQVEGEQNPLLLGLLGGLGVELPQGGNIHDRAVENLAGLKLQSIFHLKYYRNYGSMNVPWQLF